MADGDSCDNDPATTPPRSAQRRSAALAQEQRLALLQREHAVIKDTWARLRDQYSAVLGLLEAGALSEAGAAKLERSLPLLRGQLQMAYLAHIETECALQDRVAPFKRVAVECVADRRGSHARLRCTCEACNRTPTERATAT